MSSRPSSPDFEGAVGGDDTTATNVLKMDSETESVEAGMQEFYNNNRRELMFELRRIQHGEKPVTGQQHRDNINSFLSKHMQVHAQNAGKENVPANVDRVEEHRPEAVVVEVEGLYEQQPVSSLLRSTVFRRHLDDIIRRSMSSFTLTPRNSQSPSPQSSHQPSPAPPSRASQPSPNTASPRPSITPPPDRLVQSGEIPAPPPPPPVPVLDNRDEYRHALTANPQNRRDVLHAPENVEEFPAAQQVQGVSFEEGMRIQRETIVEEISELVHRGLVSSSLEGEFRGTLELHMQNRLGGIGHGDRVLDAIRSLPRDPLHRRNDFSHLGIPLELDGSDNISVTSISATAVPYSQTNLHLSREMNALRTQVEEMKNMLKMNVELQLDIQRAIRQEVAAAVATATAGPVESTTNSRRSQPVQASDCLICLENSVDSVLYQCGHMCVCYLCGKHLIDRGAKCPVCRAPIRDIIRAYKCNSE